MWKEKGGVRVHAITSFTTCLLHDDDDIMFTSTVVRHLDYPSQAEERRKELERLRERCLANDLAARLQCAEPPKEISQFRETQRELFLEERKQKQEAKYLHHAYNDTIDARRISLSKQQHEEERKSKTETYAFLHSYRAAKESIMSQAETIYREYRSFSQERMQEESPLQKAVDARTKSWACKQSPLESLDILRNPLMPCSENNQANTKVHVVESDVGSPSIEIISSPSGEQWPAHLMIPTEIELMSTYSEESLDLNEDDALTLYGIGWLCFMLISSNNLIAILVSLTVLVSFLRADFKKRKRTLRFVRSLLRGKKSVSWTKDKNMVLRKRENGRLRDLLHSVWSAEIKHLLNRSSGLLADSIASVNGNITTLSRTIHFSFALKTILYAGLKQNSQRKLPPTNKERGEQAQEKENSNFSFSIKVGAEESAVKFRRAETALAFLSFFKESDSVQISDRVPSYLLCPSETQFSPVVPIAMSEENEDSIFTEDESNSGSWSFEDETTDGDSRKDGDSALPFEEAIEMEQNVGVDAAIEMDKTVGLTSDVRSTDNQGKIVEEEYDGFIVQIQLESQSSADHHSVEESPHDNPKEYDSPTMNTQTSENILLDLTGDESAGPESMCLNETLENESSAASGIQEDTTNLDSESTSCNEIAQGGDDGSMKFYAEGILDKDRLVVESQSGDDGHQGVKTVGEDTEFSNTLLQPGPESRTAPGGAISQEAPQPISSLMDSHEVSASKSFEALSYLDNKAFTDCSEDKEETAQPREIESEALKLSDTSFLDSSCVYEAKPEQATASDIDKTHHGNVDRFKEQGHCEILIETQDTYSDENVEVIFSIEATLFAESNESAEDAEAEIPAIHKEQPVLSECEVNKGEGTIGEECKDLSLPPAIVVETVSCSSGEDISVKSKNPQDEVESVRANIFSSKSDADSCSESSASRKRMCEKEAFPKSSPTALSGDIELKTEGAATASSLQINEFFALETKRSNEKAMHEQRDSIEFARDEKESDSRESEERDGPDSLTLEEATSIDWALSMVESRMEGDDLSFAPSWAEMNGIDDSECSRKGNGSMEECGESPPDAQCAALVPRYDMTGFGGIKSASLQSQYAPIPDRTMRMRMMTMGLGGGKSIPATTIGSLVGSPHFFSLQSVREEEHSKE